MVDSNAVRRDDRLAVGLDAGVRLAQRVALRAALASYDVHGVTDDQPDGPSDDRLLYTTADRSRRRSGDVRLELALPADAQLTVGAQVERKWQESVTTSNFGDDAPSAAARRSTGGYAQLLLQPAIGSTLALGGRYEHNEQFGDFWTYGPRQRAHRAERLASAPASAPRSASRPSSRTTAAASSSATAPSTRSTRSASTPASSSTSATGR